MLEAVQPDRRGILVVDGPADVVVAADVGDPGSGGRNRVEPLQRLGGQPDVAGGQHRPDLHHQSVVVGEVADLAVMTTLAEVLHQVARSHDRLRLEDRGGAGQSGHRAQRLGQRVHLRLVLARGAQSLPHEGDRVQPDRLDAVVGEVEHDVGVLAEDVGVGPVDVPLPAVERRPDPAVECVVPGEVAGREVREHLRQARLVRVRDAAVGMHVEVVAVALLAGPGPHRPLVLGGDVVEHQVQAQRDPVARAAPG